MNPTENDEVQTPEPPTDTIVGADDNLSVNETVNKLADSLKLLDAPLETPPAQGEPSTEPPAPVAEPKETTVEPASDLKVPDTWTPEAQAAWAALDPKLKSEIDKREKDIARYVGEAQPYVGVGQAIEKIIAPFVPAFQQYKVNPYDHINGLLHAHYKLLFGQPEEKVKMIRDLIRDTGVNPAQIIDPNAPAQPATDQPWRRDIDGIQQVVRELGQGVQGVTAAFTEQRTQELAAGILDFAGDTDNHPHFWKVVDDIKSLIDRGAASTLTEAYDMAVLRNPETRAQQLAADRAKEDAALRAQEATRVAQARRATSANVTSRGQGRQPEPEETIDQTLKNTMKDIRTRTH